MTNIVNKNDRQNKAENEEQKKSSTSEEEEEQKDGINHVISKKQAKKIARRQRYLEARPAKRKLEKERKKAKKRAEAQERERLGITAIEQSSYKPIKLMSESSNKFKVIIDMDFESYMTDDEIGKAVKQLGRIYSLNRHSQQPCQLYFTSVSGKILDQMKVSHDGYRNWDINLTDKDYLSLINADEVKVTKTNFLYLSGDSEDNLQNTEDLLKDDSKVFVIGGLVDHNRHKNLCHLRAKSNGVKTAKLPIKDNITLCQRHILSTVTVFEILLHVLSDKRHWTEALKLSIPKRKIAPDKQISEEGGSADIDRIKRDDTCDEAQEKQIH